MHTVKITTAHAHMSAHERCAFAARAHAHSERKRFSLAHTHVSAHERERVQP